MNPILATLLYFVVAGIIVLIGVFIFELITTKYKDWKEIEEGNYAVALSVGGKIIGISEILMFAIYENNTIWNTVKWGVIGVILQIIVYYLFEILTVKFSVQEKLKERNIAVGIISFSISVGLGLVIGASIT
ncbi:MAG TPA: DUF350 domain-containing protein [Bacillales bacterium]|nr:DUF350 domain-containing protein [Bacillales bacterium]